MISVDLSKLSDVVKKDLVTKAVYDKLVAKVSYSDTSDFVLKTKYQTDKAELEKKIPDLTYFVKKTKLTELENKIPDNSSLATKSELTAVNVSSLPTKTALTVVENKIPNVSGLVKKTDFHTKITEIEKKLTGHNHDKYITTPQFNTLAASVFNARLAQANLITKADFDVKLSSLNRNITSSKSKHLLVQNELKNLKTFDSSYFTGKSDFKDDGTQNYLVLQPMHIYFKQIAGVGNGNYIYYWQSKRLSDERINSITTSNYSVTPFLDYHDTKIN